MQQGKHDGIVVLLWARDSEVAFFPDSHRIAHGIQGTQSRWGYTPSKEKLESCKREVIKIPQGAM